MAGLQRERGDLAAAEQTYRQALDQSPHDLAARLGLGMVYEKSDRLDQAAEQFRTAVAAHPQSAEARFRLGCVFQTQGNAELAAQAFDAAVRIQPEHADAWNNLGCVLLALERNIQAENALRNAVGLRPDFAEAHHNLGTVLQAQLRYDDAIAAYQQALALKPDFAEAHNNLGACLRQLKRPEQALGQFDRAIALRPDFADAHTNRATALGDLGRLEEAEAVQQQAVALRPLDPQMHFNLALINYQQGRTADSIAGYCRALDWRPEHAETHYNLGVALLAGGDFAAGWPEYDWRLRCRSYARRGFAEPQWDGSPLADQVLLVHAEQGLGDTLQFIRYLPLVRARAQHVWVEVQAALMPLLAQSGFTGLVPRGDQLPPFDVQAPLLTLPGVFGTTLENIPTQVPYVSVDSARVVRWRERLSEWPGLRVGISWQGNPEYEFDRHRSIPLAAFEPLARVPGVRLISLQKHFGLDQLSALAGRFEVVDLGAELDRDGAFLDTAAVMQNLDVVITSDTVGAHLAGALGARVWMAVSIVPEWRWLRDREDCPWYPSMRLIRQRERGNWDELMQRVAAELGKLPGAGGPQNPAQG